MVPLSISAPVPCLISEPPPVSLITPAKVVDAVAVPVVKDWAPNFTLVPATPLKSPIVAPEVVALISKVDVPVIVTLPADAKAPLPDKLKVPALIVVPLS